MSETIELPTERSGQEAAQSSRDREELLAQVELLRARNRRLHEEHARRHRETYRNTALGLVAVGALAFLGALAFPSLRELLVALGTTGLFAAVLTYYVTPNHVLPGSTGERVHGAAAKNTASLVQQLGLSDSRVYVPTGDSTPARLFVPQYDEYDLPSETALESPLVITNDERQRGLSLSPTGGALFREFERTLTEPLGTTPDDLLPQLRDGLTQTLELAGEIEGSSDSVDGQLSFRVRDPAWNEVDRIDHPVPSFLAVGCAVGLDTVVELSVAPVDDDGEDAIIRVSWAT